MNAGYGLTVRWSLEKAPADVAGKLRDYVVGTSMAESGSRVAVSGTSAMQKRW